MIDPIVPLSVIKKHIRTERDDEDDYLLMLLDAAVCHCQDYTGLELVSDVNEPGHDVPLYPAIRHGLLLLIGHWYENREMVTEKALSEAPAGTYDLWNPYVQYDLGGTV